jgi:hypothetical protein
VRYEKEIFRVLEFGFAEFGGVCPSKRGLGSDV